MELMTYNDAAALLDVSIGTLKQAISERGVLTRAGRAGRNMLLIRKQVMLFAGANPRTGNKKRLSFEALSPSELEEWHRLARLAIAGQETTQNIPVDQIEEIIDQRVDERMQPVYKGLEPVYKGLKDLFEQLGASKQEERTRQEERSHKVAPFHPKRTAAPALYRTS